MALNKKYQYKRETVLRDVRPLSVRLFEALRRSDTSAMVFGCAAALIYLEPMAANFADLIFFIAFIYFIWLWKTPLLLPFKLPKSAHVVDKNNPKPGGGYGNANGILYIGNEKETGEEIWFTDSDARTHILYLGTTGAGKTVGLRSIAANALCWSSGFLYIDGKADTDLWSLTYALVRRFGRDDDILIMNYMTGNVGGRVPSNTMNPFSGGSAGYLVNMLTSLMPDAEGDNAMWKERAVALVSALMPCLVWKRDNQNMPISVSVIRKYMGLGDIIQLSRDDAVPDHLRAGLVGYLNELPGYVDEAFDDDGNEKPLPPDAPPFDSSVPRQQHGYLSMQFTRSLQSLGDDYGFIFDTQAADVDMMDVVLQRRIMITLIPALEKSSDETANLGKIIASTLKGMMGATLGSTVEGSSETAIENKPARSETPFISIFDEVGYYAAQGMAVMAAQARSLGFCLVYAAQDLPAMEKRVKEEARSITANCNIKLFGKLEDPTQTKEFFEKTVGQSYVTEVSGFSRGQQGQSATNYADGGQASVQVRAKADYDELRSYNEGRAICAFGPGVSEIQVYFSDQGFAKTMRVHRFLPVPQPSKDVLNSLKEVKSVLQRLRSKKWNPNEIPAVVNDNAAMQALVEGYRLGENNTKNVIESSALALTNLADFSGFVSIDDMVEDTGAAEQNENAPAKSEAEAAAKAALEGSAGPLSWMDVIGGDNEGDSDTSPEMSVSSDEASQPASAASDEGGVSWDSLMGDDTSTPAETQEDADQLFEEIFGSAPEKEGTPQSDEKTEVLTSMKPPQTEDAPRIDIGDLSVRGDKDNLESMSWNSIMGINASTDNAPQGDTTPPVEKKAEPVLPKDTSSSKDQAPAAADTKSKSEQGEFDFADLFATPEGEDKKQPDGQMTWADIVGTGADDKPSE